MASFGTSTKTFGGLTVDRRVFRTLLPDNRWLLYAAGLLDPGDSNTATVRLVYQKNDGTVVILETATKVGGGEGKVTLGPVDLYAVPGVPLEDVAVVRLQFQKDAGADGTCVAWNIWGRLSPPNR